MVKRFKKGDPEVSLYAVEVLCVCSFILGVLTGALVVLY